LPAHAVAVERGTRSGLQYAYDATMQKLKIQQDRPMAVREAILACRSAGIVSIMGVYAGFVDKFPLGSLILRP
jgi:threonine dehydrogenase-like Zn-dependent dehydrogenase